MLREHKTKMHDMEQRHRDDLREADAAHQQRVAQQVRRIPCGACAVAGWRSFPKFTHPLPQASAMQADFDARLRALDRRCGDRELESVAAVREEMQREIERTIKQSDQEKQNLLEQQRQAIERLKFSSEKTMAENVAQLEKQKESALKLQAADFQVRIGANIFVRI